MPRWKQAAKNLTAFSRRWSLNSPAVEVLTGIIPTAQVDKHWTNDRLDLWGIFIQQAGTATANRLGSCSIVAQEKEVLVHRIVAWMDSAVEGKFVVHLFTPLQTYAPAELNAALFLPWMQLPVEPGEPGRLSRTIGVAGETDAGLQVVTVNGAPHTSIGPTYPINVIRPFVIGDHNVNVIWDSQDPPLRLRPFQQLTIQMTQQLTAAYFLDTNWFYTERDDQGKIG